VLSFAALRSKRRPVVKAQILPDLAPGTERL
jgi:hypothetical protein